MPNPGAFFDYMADKLAEATWLAANRENRRRHRIGKRRDKAARYHKVGLNGARAVARRKRQIRAGQLSPVFHKYDGREIKMTGPKHEKIAA